MTAPSVQRRMTTAMGAPDARRLRPFFETILRRLRPEFRPTSAWCFTRGGNTSDEYIAATENYVGVGSGAFSYLDGILYATTFSLAHYEQQVARGRSGITARHQLRRRTAALRFAGANVWARLDREWALQRHGPGFFRTVWGELRTLEVLGAAQRDARGWRLTDRGMYWLMLMMSEFFGSVNGYRDAMRAHVQTECVVAHPPRTLLARTSRVDLPVCG